MDSPWDDGELASPRRGEAKRIGALSPVKIYYFFFFSPEKHSHNLGVVRIDSIFFFQDELKAFFLIIFGFTPTLLALSFTPIVSIIQLLMRLLEATALIGGKITYFPDEKEEKKNLYVSNERQKYAPFNTF